MLAKEPTEQLLAQLLPSKNNEPEQAVQLVAVTSQSVQLPPQGWQEPKPESK